MAAFRNVNADGVPLNVSQAVQNDEDARNLAAHLRGPRRDPYYEPMRSLSSEDEEVHEVYEALYDIVNNPENYTAEQINDTIVDILEADDSPVRKYGSFDGNYNANLADERNSPEVFKYYKSWKRNHKNWERRGKEMKSKKLAELEKLDKYKTPDDMPRDKKRKIRNKLYEEVNEAYRKYMYGKVPLGRQIYYMIEKAEKIQEKKELGSDSDSSDDEDGGAAAVMKKPSSTEFDKMNNDEKEAAKRKKLAPLLAKMKLGSLKKSSAKPQAKPAAVAMAKPAAKPNPQVKEMFGDKWIGPYMSKSKGIEYWVRMRDRLGVFVDSSTGKLTKRNIRKTEEHNAKKAAKKGGRRTRKKRGRGNAPTISSREWVVENTQASINRFVNSNLPERDDGFNNMIRRMTSDEMDGGFWIIEWSLTRPRDDNLNHFHLAHDDEDNEGQDLIRIVDGPDAPAGRRKRRKRKTKRKKRKKKKTKRKKRKKRKKKTRRRKGGNGDSSEDDDYPVIPYKPGDPRNNDGIIRRPPRAQGENPQSLTMRRRRVTNDRSPTGQPVSAAAVAEANRRWTEVESRAYCPFGPSSCTISGGKRRRKTRKMKGGHHLYKRLGVSKYASQKQIKKAYNKIKKKKKLTKKVKYAYKILSKKKSRKKYNAKYKKMKKSKRKRRTRGGIASIIIKGKMHPGNYEPHFNIPDPNASQPAWLGNL